jgi:hypothetical protein
MKINVPTGIPYFAGTKVLDGNTYRMTFRWAETNGKWYLDLDGISNDIAIHGMALVCGYDLFKIHGYSELGELFVVDNLGEDIDPDFDSFGNRHTIEYFPLD